MKHCFNNCQTVNLQRLLHCLTVVFLFSVPCLADPYVGYCYPASIQAGTKVRVVVGGQGLGGEIRCWISGAGVSVAGIERVPVFTRAPGEGQRAWLEKWLRDLEDGVTAMPTLPKDEILRNWPRNRWWESLDKLDALSLAMVKRDHFSPRPDPLQAAPAIAERLILTVVTEANAAPGLRQLILYNNNAASAPQPFFVTKEPHVLEPLYEAPPRKGKHPPVREPVVARAPVVLDGQILPGETDVFRLALNGGDRLTCLLTGRELVPYLGDAVPGFFNPVLRLTDADGKELAFADDYHYLPDPILTCTIEKTGTYLLEVRDNLYRGRDDFVYSVACFTDDRPLPTPQERAFVCRPRPEVRGGRSEEIPSRGGSVSFDFEVESPGRMEFELFARRIGTPLDGVLRLYGPLTGLFRKEGPLLATWDDVTNGLYVGSVPQAECDPVGSWDFAEPGDYRLSVSDRVGGGGVDYGFTLDIRPSEPDFEIYAVKPSLVVHPWKTAQTRFKVKVVRRNGLDGAITVQGNEDFLVVEGTVPAGTNEAEIVIQPTQRDWTGMKRTQFAAVAETASGKSVRHPAVPGVEVEQAFAYTHVLPTTDFFLFMMPSRAQTNAPPAWIEMPYDPFLPRRVIHPSADLTPFKTNYRAGLDALAKVDVSLLKPPGDADDAVLAAKFATSVTSVRKRNCGAFAMVAKSIRPAEAARAVLAGCTGVVLPTLAYAELDEPVVRTLAFARASPPDNDILIYVQNGSGNPLAGSFGKTARRLRASGWCFDYVTDQTLTNAPLGNIYRVVYVPQPQAALPDGTRRFLDDVSRRRKCSVVFADEPGKGENRRMAGKARREWLPKGLRFARFGRKGGEGWYFVHNPTTVRVSGEARFNVRGGANVAYLMDVATGRVRQLDKASPGKFALSLEAGVSVWIRVTSGPH